MLGVLTLASGCVMTLVTDPNAYTVAVDDFPALHQFTQTAIVALSRALAATGVTTAIGGKSIVLEVTSPTTAPGFGMARCSAVTNAVESLLKDPALREYLAKP